ncbi:MAG: bifunctional (p)ppGpp synthetase/guanosine-3',5'-bis(diphosphate) 3'-pyrophosphohydrolase [Planctomycetes bacterium]|nr:bifunctional (p)ppGpp synthetase/guanosine-3',5'-bis(diphosphate) 3'-pyrophosphohydrolase [Planctomycetota bacterium]
MRNLIKKAKLFATNAHAEVQQVRKYTGKPYIVHPASVASIVSSVTRSENLIALAWLHDTVEDTKVSLGDIDNEFGNEVMQLVESLTDTSKPEDGNRKMRKEIDRQHLRLASQGAKTVKLADLIDNSKSIIEHGKSFAPIFIQEMSLLLEVLKEGDQKLFKQAEAIVYEYQKS